MCFTSAIIHTYPALYKKTFGLRTLKVLITNVIIMSFSVQEFNRDLSIAVIQLHLDRDMKRDRFKDGVQLLEALSASGLR